MNISTIALAGAFLISLLGGSSENSSNTPTRSPADSLALDIKHLCAEVVSRYAYYQERSTHWGAACDLARTEALQTKDSANKLEVLERLLDELYDPHVSLNTNNGHSPRLVPSGSDIRFELEADNYIVTAVRPGSGAASSGITVGDQLVRFNGLTPDKLALTRIRTGAESAPKDRFLWAINAAVAGRRDQSRDIEIQRNGELYSFTMADPTPVSLEEPVTSERLAGNIGYIRFNNSLGNQQTVQATTAALTALRQARGIILDLRMTPSGGDTSVAEPILGRFINAPAAYQLIAPRDSAPVERMVYPAQDWTFEGPLIILVGQWTGSMGEGIAVGFDGMGRGTVMGTAMAGLAGGTEPIKLPASGISVWMPTYDILHINGTPRHDWRPTVFGIADNGDGPDLLLQDALKTLADRDSD